MIPTPRLTQHCGALSVLALAIGTSLPGAAGAQELVYVRGISASISSGERAFQQAQDSLCAAEAGEVAAPLRIIDVVSRRTMEAAQRSGVATWDVEHDIVDTRAAAIRKAVELCQRGTPVQMQFFNIIYAECRMTMHDGNASVDVRFPASGGAMFDLIDYADRRVLRQPLDLAEYLGDQVAQGTSRAPTLEATGARREYATPSLRADVAEYEFSSSFEFDPFGAVAASGTNIIAEIQRGSMTSRDFLAGFEQFGGAMPTIAQNGKAWLARDIDGADTVRAFYRNFAAVIDSGQGGGLMAGLFNHFLLSEGLPLEIEQTTQMEFATPGTLIGGLFQMPPETTATSIQSVIVLPMPQGYCENEAIPDGFAVVDPAAALTSNAAPQPAGGPAVAASSTAGQLPGGAAAAGSPEMAAAMAEMNSALANMTDEQRAAMSQFGAGFGQLIGGLAANEAAVAGGGAGTEAQDQALQGVGAGLAGIFTALDGGQGNVQVTPNGAAPPAPVAAARPSSSSLMTDNLTQSAQNMLGALGYDTGDANGELHLQTVIAISQFQAEKGLEVTGAVTPQLVGILAAEVDAP